MKKIFIILVSLGLLSVTSLRALNFTVFYDKSSGFFSDNGLLSYIALGIFALIALLGAVLISRKLSPQGEYKENKSPLMGAVSAFSAVLFFYASYEMFFEYNSLSTEELVATTAMGISLRLPVLIFTFLAGVYFVISVFAFFTGNGIFSKVAFLPLVPVVWSLIFTLFLFMHYSISVLQTENAFVILSSVFISYSLLQYAFFISKVGVKRLRKLTVSSLWASVLSVSFALSSVIKSFAGVEANGDVPLYVSILMLSSGIYILLFILTMKYSEEEKGRFHTYKAKRYKK